MGLELAKAAYVRIRGDGSALPGDLAQAQAEVISGLRDIAEKGLGVLALFSFKAKGILSKGLSQAGDLEETTIKFETMLGSAQAAQDTLSDLTDFSVKTPFEMPGILRVSTEMIQFGERGQGLMDTLQMLGDASGGTEAQFSILGTVFNQVRGVGKLLTQDFRQLSTRGIISLQDIADHYKTTTNAAQDMLSSGKVSFEDFRKILSGLTKEGGRFHNMMIKQSTSLKGLASTLNDAWNILYRTLAESMLPVVKVFQAWQIKIVESAIAWVKASEGVASGALVGATALSALVLQIKAVTIAFRVLGMTVRSAIIGTGIGALVLLLGGAIGALVAKNQEWIIGMVKASGILEKIQVAGARAWDLILDRLKALVKASQPLMKAMYNVAVWAWNGISSIAIGAYNAISDFIQSHQEDFTQIWFLIQEIAMNAFDAIQEGWKFVVDFFTEWSRLISMSLGFTFEESKGYVRSFFDYFVEDMKTILDWVSLLSTDWNLTWQFIKVTVDKWLLQIQASIFSAIVQIRVRFLALGAAIKAVFAGRDPQRAFNGIINAFNKMPKIDWFGKEIKRLDMEGKDLIQKMKEAREKLREERNQPEFLPEMEIADIELPQLQPMAEKAAETIANALEQGRVGFLDLSNKFQDKLLKGGEGDLDAKRNDLLQLQLKKQDDLLKAVQAQKPAGALT